MKAFAATFAALAFGFFALPASAAYLPQPTHSVVQVQCADRRGSGVIIDASKRLILTNGHVPIDPVSLKRETFCVIIFPQPNGASIYDATLVQGVFDERKNLDFAVLAIGNHVRGDDIAMAAVPVDDTPKVGAPVTVYGFPSSSALETQTGTIKSYSFGNAQTDAQFTEGYSGGPAVDERGDLVGLATKIRFSIDPVTGAETVIDHELEDVLPLMTWLDSVGGFRSYLSLNDGGAFDQQSYAIRSEKPYCLQTVRTIADPTIYCITTGIRRYVFPDASTFRSWYPNYSGVVYAKAEQIAGYQLFGNVTYRAGSLIRVHGESTVYLVTDSIGTLRWIQSEKRAVELFGKKWYRNVHVIPTSLFTNYTVAAPL